MINIPVNKSKSLYEVKFWNEEIETMSLKELVELQNKNLRESKVIERAYKSSVYRDRWDESNVDITSIKTREDLKKIPLSSSDNVRAALTGKLEDYICTEDIRFWFATSGTTGVPKWIPYSDDEIDTLEETLMRTVVMLNQEVKANASKPFKMVFMTTPSPFASGSMGYGVIFVPLLMNLSFETLVFSLSAIDAGISASMRRKPNGIIIMPSLAMKFAVELKKQATPVTRANYEKKKTLKNYLLYLATKLINVKPKHVFRTKIICTGGEPLEPYRESIKKAWGTSAFDLYATTEYPIISPECASHNGIHVWLDLCINEIIPKEELDKESLDPNYKVKTLFLDEAPPGTTGELVFTTFGSVLPLIRYRISDNVKLISLDRCSCGRTHPRIQFLQRKDDMINLGVIRFSTLHLEEKFQEVSNYGEVAQWQVVVQRVEWRAKFKFLIEVKNVKDEVKLKQEITDKILELKQINASLENGMLAPLEINFIDNLEEERTGTGKLRHVIYERLEGEM